MERRFEVWTSWQLFRQWLAFWSTKHICEDRRVTLHGYSWAIGSHGKRDVVDNPVEWVYGRTLPSKWMLETILIELTALETKTDFLLVKVDVDPEADRLFDVLMQSICAVYPEAAASFPGKTFTAPTSEIPKSDDGDTATGAQSDQAAPDQAGDEAIPGLIDKKSEDWYRWLLKCKTLFSNGDMSWDEIGRNFSVTGRTAKRKLHALQKRNLPGLEDWPKRPN